MATDVIARALAVSGGGGGSSDGYTKAEVDALLTKKEDDILHFKTWEDYEKVKNTIPVDTYFVIEEETGEDVYKKIEQIESEIAVQTARIDQLVGTVPPGSADEIADARVMTDGKTAANLGDAIRTQSSRLKEQFNEIYDVVFHAVPVTLNYTKGYWGDTNNHAYDYSANYYRSANIDLTSKASIYFNNSNYQTRVLAWKFDGVSYTDVTRLHDYTDGLVDIELSNHDWYCIGINIKRVSGEAVTSEDLANIQQGLIYSTYVPTSSADEIADARMMADGETANNLGDAIRTQCTQLKNQISDSESRLSKSIDEISDVVFQPITVALNYTKGYWGNTNNHAYAYSASYYRSGNIDLPSKASIYFNDPDYQTRIIAWKFDGTSYTDVTLLHDYTDGAVDIQLSNQDWYCIGINIKRLSGGSVTSEDLTNIQQGLTYTTYEPNANPLHEYETICENGCLCSSQGQLLFKKLANLEQNCNFQALAIYGEHIYAFGHTSDSVGFIKKYNMYGTLIETKTQDTAFHHVIGVDSFGDGKFLVSSREGASASEGRKFYVYDFDANQILNGNDFPSVEGYTSIATNVIDSGHYMFMYSDLSAKAMLKTFVYDVSENALNERADIITNYKYVQDAFLSNKIVYAHTNDGTGADGELVIFNYVTGEILGKIAELGLGEIEGCHIQKEESYIYMYFIDNSHKRLYKAKLQ